MNDILKCINCAKQIDKNYKDDYIIHQKLDFKDYCINCGEYIGIIISDRNLTWCNIFHK